MCGPLDYLHFPSPNTPPLSWRKSSASAGTGSMLFPLSLIMRKPTALEQAKKGIRNVDQHILFCFTQPTDLEVTRNNSNSAIQIYVEYFDIFVKSGAWDQGSHPISSVLVKAWQNQPWQTKEAMFYVHVEHVYVIDSTGNCTRENSICQCIINITEK